MANRVVIQIAGQRYTMRADETVEYMNEVAEMAQQTITLCGGSASFASTRALALATVNLADDYLKAKRAAEEAEAKYRTAAAELDELRRRVKNAESADQTTEEADAPKGVAKHHRK